MTELLNLLSNLTDAEKAALNTLSREIAVPGKFQSDLHRIDRGTLLDVFDKIYDKLDSLRVDSYALESTLERIQNENHLLPGTMSEFQSWLKRKGLNAKGEEAGTRLKEILESNPNFDFEN